MIKIYKILRDFSIIIIVLFSFSSNAYSLSEEQRKALDSGALYHNTEQSNPSCGPNSNTASNINSAYILGDSITNQSRAEIQSAASQNNLNILSVNAVPGRAISLDTTSSGKQTGIEAVQADKSIIAQSDAIVVALGTNSGTEDLNAQIPALITEIKKANQTAEIFWVNLFYTKGTSVGDRNATITALSQTLSYKIIDASSAGIELGVDGVHPTIAGQKTFADTIVNRLVSGNISGAVAVDGEVKPIVGGNSTDGNQAHILSYLNGLDEVAAANAINTYIQSLKPESPFVGLGSSFVAGGKKYNVNPFLAVGHLQHENGFATASGGWHTTTPPSYNAFGRRASSTQPYTIYVRASGEEVRVFKWSSWAASLDGNNGTEDPWFALINRKYLAADGDFKIASGDFETYLSHYAPQSDGNNEAAYVRGLKDTIDSIVELMGSGVIFAGSQNTSCSEGVAGANGWGLPGEQNPMIYYSQQRESSSPKDPAVTSYWGDSPYGEGTIAQCGCGPTSFAMIVATLKNDPSVTPETVASWAAENNFRSGSDACSGSSWWWVDNTAETLSKWGVTSRQITIGEASSELQQGRLIIVSVGPGSPFLSEGGDGHLLVMRAVTSDGKYLFADPSDTISKRANGGDGAVGVDSNIFNGSPPGSSHTPVDESIVTQGLKGLFVVQASGGIE